MFNRISKFKRILNAYTHNIRITNADGQGAGIKIYRTSINYKQIKSGKGLILFVVEQLFLLEKSSGYAYVYYGEGLEFFYNIDIITLFAPNFLEASCDICAIVCYDIRYTAPKENTTFH